MTEILLTEIVDAGDDVLQLTGYVDGEPVTATGWVSAIANHYDPAAYGDGGHRQVDAEPRAMTADEVRAYAEGLLLAAAGLTTEAAGASPVAELLAAVALDEPPPDPDPEPVPDPGP